MILLRLSVLVLLFLAMCPGGALAAAQRVALPITLDHAFLRSILIYQMFTAPNQRALVAEKDQGCTRIVLWEPQVSTGEGLLRIRTKVRVKAGMVVFGKCLDPVDWQGYVEVSQRVWVEPVTWLFRVKTVDSRLYDINLEPTTVGDLVWGLIKKHVHAYLDRFKVNLAPPVNDLKGQLPLLFKPEKRRQVQSWLAGLKPGAVTVDSAAVRIQALLDVELPPAAPPGEGEKAPATEQEILAFTRYWEVWDSYLVQEIMSLSGATLSESDRNLLLTTLLEVRHGFVQALAQPAPGRDLVRGQFLYAWRALAPILRKTLVKDPSPSLFNYLAFFTASDALDVLDKLGPALGLDISREGLLRLARLVSRRGGDPDLRYGTAVNADLRRLLGLGPPLDESGPAFDVQELKETSGRNDQGRSWLWPNLGASPAWAAPPQDDQLAEVLKWLPSQQEADDYIARVRAVMKQAADDALSRDKLSEKYHPFFHGILPAVVWQESCWRQFVVKAGKITFLRSYNNTSVGLMQVNERVWRGLYKPASLRWNIRYNAKAGCEILELYLRRYVLELFGDPQGGGDDRLALAVYAAYNGGPARLERFVKSRQTGKRWLAERLFSQKLDMVKQGKTEAISKCLGGK